MFITLCYYLRQFMKYFYELPDYYIERVSMDYYANVLDDMDEVDKITNSWKSQSYYWDDYSDTPYHWDITPDIRKNGIETLKEILAQIPNNVSGLVYTIKYTYGNKSYKFISRNTESLVWPPNRSGFKFITPFLSVWALDDFGNEVKEITKHFKKAAGPKGDFHNQDVKVMDIMKYDYAKVRVKYIMSSKVLTEDDSVLSMLN